MVRLLQCEFLKLKRKSLFKFFLIIALFFPIFNSVLVSDQNLADMMIGNREDSGFLLLIPFLVMLATQLFFEEYDNRTLKNILMIPVERKKVVWSKLFFLLIISVSYELFGYIATIFIAYIQGVVLEGLGLQFFLTLLTGIFIWSAALPCIIVTIYFNKSYIISFIIAFFYTLVGFVFHLSDVIMMKPVGINLGTLLPVPAIFKWLYQYNIPEGKVMIEFYERFQPYFISTYQICIILFIETCICFFLIDRIYRRMEV